MQRSPLLVPRLCPMTAVEIHINPKMTSLATGFDMPRLDARGIARTEMCHRQDDLPLGPLGWLMIALDTPAWPWVSAM